MRTGRKGKQWQKDISVETLVSHSQTPSRLHLASRRQERWRAGSGAASVRTALHALASIT